MKRLFKQQDGIALIVALGTLTVLAIGGTTAAVYTTSNARTVNRSAKDEMSFSLSEAALNNAMAVLSNPSNNALDPDVLPASEALASSVAYEGGTAKWWGILDRANAVWTVHALGLYNNPTGAGVAQVRRKLTAKVPVFPTNTQPNNNPAWSYIYSRATGSPCDVTLANNLSGSSQFYAAGNLCLSNNVDITAAALIVQGNLDLGNNADVGASTSMSTRVETYVGGQCRYGGGTWASPCSGNQDSRHIFSKINGAVGVNSSAPVIPEPDADFAEWYENSIPGPSQSCTTVSGSPPVFDNNYPTRNNSVSTAFELTPASSYSCRVGPASNASGELSWNATTKVLTVKGTIFIDGSAKVTNGGLNQYNGQSTLYLSGTFAMNNSSKLCGGISGGNCDFSAWDPNTEMLTIIAEGTGGDAGVGNSIKIDNNGQFQGGLFGEGAVEFSNNARSDGPIVGSTVKFNNNVQNDQFPTITIVPVGMPGNPVVYAQPNPPEMFAG
jgi:uncharacterized membrane protein YgcG